MLSVRAADADRAPGAASWEFVISSNAQWTSRRSWIRGDEACLRLLPLRGDCRASSQSLER